MVTPRIHWLQHAGQRLGLVPELGGAVAAWRVDTPSGPLDLWRPWDGITPSTGEVCPVTGKLLPVSTLKAD